MHTEWEDRMFEVCMYLHTYLSGASLTKEEAADLHQVLQAVQYIAMDFRDFAPGPQATYDAMYDDEHEMIERVKFRLSAKY
ncbi:MAG: hypothetical protein ACI33P_07730 [Lysinibacillus sp.]